MQTVHETRQNDSDNTKQVIPAHLDVLWGEWNLPPRKRMNLPGRFAAFPHPNKNTGMASQCFLAELSSDNDGCGIEIQISLVWQDYVERTNNLLFRVLHYPQLTCSCFIQIQLFLYQYTARNVEIMKLARYEKWLNFVECDVMLFEFMDSHWPGL